MNQHVKPRRARSSASANRGGSRPICPSKTILSARSTMAECWRGTRVRERPLDVPGREFDQAGVDRSRCLVRQRRHQRYPVCAQGPDTRDVYVCLSTQRESEERVSRRASSTACRSARSRTPLRSSRCSSTSTARAKATLDLNEAAVALADFIKAIGLPKPTIMVASGGGLHVYWVVSRALTPDEWKPLGFALAEATKRHGLKCDSRCTIDSARVLRIPNTFNRKTDPPRPVAIAGTPQDFDYSVERMEQRARAV